MKHNKDERPIYTMSASLLNNLKWYKKQRTAYYKDQAKQQLISALKKEYSENEHTIRGHKFETEVMAQKGMHPEFFVDMSTMHQQKWYNKYIEYGDFIIKLVGKFDLYDEKDRQIYDIKRPLNYSHDKYEDDSTIQHDLSLYLNDEANRFTYLIAHGDGNNIRYCAIPVERKPNLEEYIIQHIEEFIIFLHKEDLLNLYFTNYEVDF